MQGAIVHEWIAANGGAERVADEISQCYPHDPIYTLWRDPSDLFAGRAIHESVLASHPWLRDHKPLALPLMPWIWRRLDLRQYDRIIVSSHLFAHHVASNITAADALISVYVHTPARYIWAPELDERGDALLARIGRQHYRKVDRTRTSAKARYAANSYFIQERICHTWGREAEVIYPPVDVLKLQEGRPWHAKLKPEECTIVESLPHYYVMAASRLVPYKRVDEAIRLGSALGIPVVIAGSGPELPHLRAMAHDAPVPVAFVPSPSSMLLYALIERAALFIFPPVEDFGIVPVEAMSLGTPVLVNRHGGARESVERVRGGTVADFSDTANLKVQAARAIDTDLNAAAERVRYFDARRFRTEIGAWAGEEA
ncbi:glycosyltransferase [Nocardioides pakistanensis]